MIWYSIPLGHSLDKTTRCNTLNTNIVSSLNLSKIYQCRRLKTDPMVLPHLPEEEPTYVGPKHCETQSTYILYLFARLFSYYIMFYWIKRFLFHFIKLYYIILYYIKLYQRIFCFSMLYSIKLYIVFFDCTKRNSLYHTILYCTVLYYTIPHYITLYCMISNYILVYSILSNYSTLCYPLFYFTGQYFIMLYLTIVRYFIVLHTFFNCILSYI